MRRSSVVRFHGRRSPRSSAEEQRVSTPRVAGSSPAGELSHSRLVVGEFGHPTGFGRRRSQVRVLPTRLIALSGAARGRGAAVLASLMSSRPWVRIPPAPSTGTVRRRAGREVTEQGLCRARALTCGWAVKPPGPTGEEVAAWQSRRQDCRKVKQPAPEQNDGNVSASGCGEPIPPSIFFLGGRGVTASIRGRDPRRCRFEPDRPPCSFRKGGFRRSGTRPRVPPSAGQIPEGVGFAAATASVSAREGARERTRAVPAFAGRSLKAAASRQASPPQLPPFPQGRGRGSATRPRDHHLRRGRSLKAAASRQASPPQLLRYLRTPSTGELSAL